MRIVKSGLLCGAAALVFGVSPAHAQSPTGTGPGGADKPDTAAAPAAIQTSSPDIIVTARRTNERLVDVPVAVSVVTPSTIATKGVFTPVDIAESAPGLTVTATTSDRNNLTYTIRGQGFSYGTIFPAVITYFDEVPITQLTTGQFFDLANVQVLRGPQGVNFGRVTDGGNVMVSPQEPKNEFGGYLSVKLGDYNLKTVDAALNVPIVEDKILARGALEIGRRDGFTKNIYNGQDLDNVDYESYRFGLTLKPTETLTNTTIVAYQHTHDNGTAVILAGLNDPVIAGEIGGFALFGGGYGINARGDVVAAGTPGSVPFNAANYVAAQNAQLAEQQALGPRRVDHTDPSFDRRNNLYVVNTTTAQLSDNIQLKNIFGYVNVKDVEASNFAAGNGNLILTCHSACGQGGTLPFNSQEQLSEELRLSGKSFDNKLTWAIGGYADRQKPGEAFENDTINVAILERDNVQYATTKSRAGYASAEYDLGDLVQGLKVNGGVRYTHDTVVSSNATYLRLINSPTGASSLAAALTPVLEGEGLPPATAAAAAAAAAAGTYQPVPHGQCTSYGAASLLGAVNCITYRSAFNAFTYTAGASYKVQGGPLLYAKVSKGYRPGGVNGSAPAGSDPTYKPEHDLSVEIGLKGEFHLGGEALLRTEIAAYHDHYTGILKNVVVPGPVPVSLERNVDDGTIQGVELEATLIPFRGLSFGGTFAYTDAKFNKHENYAAGSCDPTASNTVNPADPSQVGFCPFNRFNAVPKVQFSLTADYSLPLDPDYGRVTLGGKYYHQSSTALTDTSVLNPNAIEKAYGTLDLNVTWENVMRNPIDLSFFMTNVTDKLYRIGSNDLLQNSSVGVRGNIYGAPRMFGFGLKYRFGADAR